ncbi:MAG TPA: hypothetical protein VK030_02220 [Actinomycetales bacterium]|nr:hypothetical protein [Actinomycetales bacterium]
MEIKGPRPNLTRQLHREVSAARLAMWNLVAQTSEPLTAARAAELAHTHVNTAREHLEGLHHSGVVRRIRQHAGGRGRPSWAYELITPPGVVDSEYAGLATALARQLLRSSENPQQAAREAGEEWGRELAAQYAASHEVAATPERHQTGRPTPSEIAAAVIHVLTNMGFAPQPDADDPQVTRLTRCPLLDASLKYPQVVCQVHAGLMTGIMNAFGASDAGMELTPFAEPGACLVTFDLERA